MFFSGGARGPAGGFSPKAARGDVAKCLHFLMVFEGTSASAAIVRVRDIELSRIFELTCFEAFSEVLAEIGSVKVVGFDAALTESR